MKTGRPDNNKSIQLYVTLQVLALVGCWAWFGALWAIAFLEYGPGDLEWWVLVAAACAGLYGLRPNLERAIDAAWLQGLDSSRAVAERAAQLRPIKRRIDLVFSLALVLALALFGLAWLSGLVAVKV